MNDEQLEAVDIIDGPLLVLAGPGTGKTQLLSVRAANMINKGKAEPENILILTFTNAAARAMRERLARIIGHEGYNIEVETFHSFANSIILESESAIKYVKDKIDITDLEKVRSLQYILDNVKGMEPLKPFGAPYMHLVEIGNRISELKNEGISPGELKNHLKDLVPDGINIEEKHIPRLKALSLAYEKYERLKNEESSVLFDERGRKDFDDMILIALDALRKDADLRVSMREQYKYVMVDEYQDTNGAQLQLLFSILDPERPNLCCVGDDDQSIYRFQGATLSNFRVLKETFPGLKTVLLKDNYRSTDGIIDLSKQIISQLPNEERVAEKILDPRRDYKEKKIQFLEFMTEEEELAFMIAEIRKQAGTIKKDSSLDEGTRDKPYNSMAVLVRKRDQRQKVIEAFLKAGIPYASDGKEDIRMEKRVRQMLDVLELAHVDLENNERKSLALYKLLTSDYTGASQSDVLKLIGRVNAKKRVFRGKDLEKFRSVNLFSEFFAVFPVSGETPPSEEGSRKLRATKDMALDDPLALHRAAWALNRVLKDARANPIHDILMRYIEDTGLYRFILESYEDNQVVRVRDLRALVSFINMIKESSLSSPSLRLDDLMQELELREVHGMPINGELATLSQDGVRIYTAHSAKGLEFHTVFLPFCLEQKSWPVRSKGDVVPLPPDIYKSKEKVDEKKKLKLLNLYDELRLFYVASTRAKANLIYTATPGEKVIISRFLSHVDLNPGSGSPSSEEDFLSGLLRDTRERDALQEVSGILKDIVKDLTLNPTSLNNYITCRRKFLYDNVLMLPGRKNQNLVFGNCAHKALEEVYKYFMDKKKFPHFSFFKKAFLSELEYQGVSDNIKKGCAVKLDDLDGWYTKMSRSPVMPLDLENKLEISIPCGPVFRGTFDKIEREEEGAIKVIDYKTGKPDKHVKAIFNCKDLSRYECDDYYRQLIAYKMLYEKALQGRRKERVTKGVLQFLEPVAETVKKYGLEKGTYREETVELTEDMVGELERVIIKCWKDIQGLKFDKLSERDDRERCRICQYDSICWG